MLLTFLAATQQDDTGANVSLSSVASVEATVGQVFVCDVQASGMGGMAVAAIEAMVGFGSSSSPSSVSCFVVMTQTASVLASLPSTSDSEASQAFVCDVQTNGVGGMAVAAFESFVVFGSSSVPSTSDAVVEKQEVATVSLSSVASVEAAASQRFVCDVQTNGIGGMAVAAFETMVGFGSAGGVATSDGRSLNVQYFATGLSSVPSSASVYACVVAGGGNVVVQTVSDGGRLTLNARAALTSKEHDWEVKRREQEDAIRREQKRLYREKLKTEREERRKARQVVEQVSYNLKTNAWGLAGEALAQAEQRLRFVATVEAGGGVSRAKVEGDAEDLELMEFVVRAMAMAED